MDIEEVKGVAAAGNRYAKALLVALESLEWYGEVASYITGDAERSEAHKDAGERARHALQKIREQN